MILGGWLKFIFTSILFFALVVIIVHYYLPKRKEDADKVERPKHRMLEDDDHDAPR